MNALSRTMIPAAPGWSVLCPCWGERDVVAVAEPVIAWLLVDEGDIGGSPYIVTWPITTDGVPNGNTAVRSPCGEISIPQDRNFADEAELAAYWLDAGAGR